MIIVLLMMELELVGKKIIDNEQHPRQNVLQDLDFIDEFLQNY
jgi:hypothetical protein